MFTARITFFGMRFGTACLTSKTNDSSFAIPSLHHREPFRINQIHFSSTLKVFFNGIRRIPFPYFGPNTLPASNLLDMNIRELHQWYRLSHFRFLLWNIVCLIEIRIIDAIAGGLGENRRRARQRSGLGPDIELVSNLIVSVDGWWDFKISLPSAGGSTFALISNGLNGLGEPFVHPSRAAVDLIHTTPSSSLFRSNTHFCQHLWNNCSWLAFKSVPLPRFLVTLGIPRWWLLAISYLSFDCILFAAIDYHSDSRVEFENYDPSWWAVCLFQLGRSKLWKGVREIVSAGYGLVMCCF